MELHLFSTDLLQRLFCIPLLTLVEERRPKPDCLDWASAGVWVFAAVGAVPLDPLGLEQQAGAAGWWVEPSAAVSHPVTAAWLAGQVSPAVVGLLVSGLFAAAGIQTVVSDSEANLDQKKVSGREELPAPAAVSEQPRG